MAAPNSRCSNVESEILGNNHRCDRCREMTVKIDDCNGLENECICIKCGRKFASTQISLNDPQLMSSFVCGHFGHSRSISTHQQAQYLVSKSNSAKQSAPKHIQAFCFDCNRFIFTHLMETHPCPGRKLINCTRTTCPAVFQIRFADQHEAECGEKWVKCGHWVLGCHHEMKRKDLPRHEMMHKQKHWHLVLRTIKSLMNRVANLENELQHARNAYDG